MVILQDQNFSSFSTTDRENLRVLNLIQIYLFLLFQSAILNPWFLNVWVMNSDL